MGTTDGKRQRPRARVKKETISKADVSSLSNDDLAKVAGGKQRYTTACVTQCG